MNKNFQDSISRREFLKTTGQVAAVSALAGIAIPYVHAAESRPNVVFILADDLGIEALGCNGGTTFQTPNLDALAASGMRFTRCYSNPLCSPSRVALMTGQYNFRNYHGWGVFDPKAQRTFGHLLRDAGYVTAQAGKWQFDNFLQHPNHVRDSGFEEYCAWTWHFNEGLTPRYWHPSLWQDGRLLEGTAKRYGPDIETAFLIDFIKKNKDHPFLAYYPMTLVHVPHTPTPDSAAGSKQVYADMVAYMDKLVGKLVATLDELNLRDRTLILFTGDNGTIHGWKSVMNGQEIIGGKGEMTDRGSHVPLIANWHGITPAGKVCADLVDFTDFFPTLAEVTGIPLPKDRPVDGHSFAPQIRGKKGKPRQWALVELNEKRFVMDVHFKLDHLGNLYDIRNAPAEEKLIDPGTESAEAKAARARLAKALQSLPPGRKGRGGKEEK